MSTSESIYFMISNLGTHFFLNPSHLTLSSGDWLPKGVKKEVEYWRGPRTVQLRVSSPSLTQHLYYLKFVLHCQVFFWPPPHGPPVLRWVLVQSYPDSNWCTDPNPWKVTVSLPRAFCTSDLHWSFWEVLSPLSHLTYTLSHIGELLSSLFSAVFAISPRFSKVLWGT